jgi:hypothetical protein
VLIFIRYNPDPYKDDHERPGSIFEIRMLYLTGLIEKIDGDINKPTNIALTRLIHVHYLCYNGHENLE